LPILPPTTTAPYDTLDTALNFARAIANDMELSTAGDLLADTEPGTQTLANLAWREFQDMLVENGVECLIKEQVMYQFPFKDPTVQTDPSYQVSISWTGSFDGSNYFTTPALPSDMIEPLRLWERQSGTQDPFVQMNPVNDGLPSVVATGYLTYWDWRNDAIWMVGSVQMQDLRMRYSAYYSDFVTLAGVQWYQQPIPIIRSAQALAYYLVATFAGGRGSPYYASVLQKGADCIQKLISRTARKKQRGNHRRRAYGAYGYSTLTGW
jgi:hypothetical protein